MKVFKVGVSVSIRRYVFVRMILEFNSTTCIVNTFILVMFTTLDCEYIIPVRSS